MNLPEKYLQSMTLVLGDNITEYEKSLSDISHHGIRINTSKLSCEEFARLKAFEGIEKKVSWCGCGYYYDDNIPVTKSPYYYAGLYYIQEPSAMLPAALLPVGKDDKVLDICAAPGGKSTQLAAKLNGTGLLFANDISNSRAKALLKNLELFGLSNIAVSSENHEKLAASFPQYFDKILVDAPCSGEGMFRREPGMVNSWLEKGPEYYAEIQEDILEHAYRMLKPGGMMLYSTCTFSPLEDEGNVAKLLERHADLELVPIKLSEGMRHGLCDKKLNAFGIELNTDTENVLMGCARIFPQDGLGEGHFAALISKKNDYVKENKNVSADCLTSNLKTLEKYPKAYEFFENVDSEFFKNGTITELNNKLYLIPEGLKLDNIRYLRTGLLLGELVGKNNSKQGYDKGKRNSKKQNETGQTLRFEPSQALAMTLNNELFKNRVDYSSDSPYVIKYLKGETLEAPENCSINDGWVLVTVEGYPLGFAVKNGDTLKNKYYPGWRLM